MVLVARGTRPGRAGRGGSACPDMPVASTSCFGPQREWLALALDLDGPLARLLGVRRAAWPSVRRPVGDLHHLGVGLQPVGDLVLRREDRPVVGELHVGQVVVPDRVVQAQRLVAAAPLVARAGGACRSRGSARRAGGAARRARCRPGRRRPPGRRAGVVRAEVLRLPLAASPARCCAACRRRARHPRAQAPLRLLVALQLVHRGEQRPRLAVRPRRRGGAGRARARQPSRT